MARRTTRSNSPIVNLVKVTVEKQFTSLPARPLPERRAVDRLLTALDQIAENSPRIISRSLGQFESAGRNYSLPRYVYLGPKSGGDVILIGIFATIHGDEPEGALALTRFVTEL